MCDATELLHALYDRIAAATRAARSAGLALGADLDGCMGLQLHEYVYCQDCMQRTHDQQYIQWYHCTQVRYRREWGWTGWAGGGLSGAWRAAAHGF